MKQGDLTPITDLIDKANNIIPEIISNIPENHKQCKKCNTILKNNEFRSRKLTCIKCENIYRKEYYYKNII